MKKQTLLSQACRNSYGYWEVTPGTDLARQLGSVSESTIRRYVAYGWLKQIGTGLVLTKRGYEATK